MTDPTSNGPTQPSSGSTGGDSGLLERLRHHKVIEWTLAYAAAAYTLLHGVEMLSEAQEWPRVIVRVLSLVLILGTPVIATIAWYHGAKGLKRISGPELAILTVLLFIAGTLLWVLGGRREPATSEVAAAAKPAASTTQTAAGAAPRTAVAVLPFANQTGDPKNNYLGEGLATALIDALSRVPGLRVPAKTSSFAYQGRNVDARQIGRDLNVGTVLEGAVQLAGNRIRVTAQLSNATDGATFWSQPYDRQLTDLFKLQDELATSIAGQLRSSLQAGGRAVVIALRPTQDLEAYQLYLQAWSMEYRGGVANNERAVALFRQALDRDGQFARAYAGLAEALMGVATNYPLRAPKFHDDAAQAARAALALDPTLPEPHNALSGIAGSRGNYLDLEAHGREAVALGGNDGWTRAIHALNQSYSGHLKAATAEGRRAYELAPATPLVLTYYAVVLSRAGDHAEALRLANRAVDLGFSPTAYPLPEIDFGAAMAQSHYDKAGKLLLSALTGDDADQARAAQIVKLVFTALEDSSKRPAAIDAATRVYGSYQPTSPAACLVAAYSYAYLDAMDTAYALANRCISRSTQYMYGYYPTTLFASEQRRFRADARFGAFVTRLGMMEYFQQYGPPDGCELKGSTLKCG